MRGAVIYGERDVRFDERPDPVIQEPTDAIVRTVAACVCGSDLWRYRGISPVPQPTPIGHEFVGVVEQVGADVRQVSVGQFVVGPFLYSDNTCPTCAHGMQSQCPDGGEFDGAQSEFIRVPLADGTLVATPDLPGADQVADLLALSDVMGTGWHAALSAGVQPGCSVAVVGDGAVGLCGVLAAAQMGAERIIAMSRHGQRQQLAREFGATDIVAERGAEGVASVRELTQGIGADAVLECVGTQDSIVQAVQSARPGGMVGWVGVPHVSESPLDLMFSRNVGIRGGSTPARQYIPQLLEPVLAGRIRPGKVFDLSIPLAQVAEGYAAMDARRAIKTMLTSE
ncbi:MAG: zinc-dependent alcohol dehydrogenase family protein [Beutenbergiaceae bacterium]